VFEDFGNAVSMVDASIVLSVRASRWCDRVEFTVLTYASRGWREAKTARHCSAVPRAQRLPSIRPQKLWSLQDTRLRSNARQTCSSIFLKILEPFRLRQLLLTYTHQRDCLVSTEESRETENLWFSSKMPRHVNRDRYWEWIYSLHDVCTSSGLLNSRSICCELTSSTLKSH
jgi:hypothetical protein